MYPVAKFRRGADVCKKIAILFIDNLLEKKAEVTEETVMDRNVNIIIDLKGNRIVLINDIIFKGKRSVN